MRSLETLRCNSGPSRAWLQLSWSLFWVPGGFKAVSRVKSLVGLCEPLRNMRLHVRNAHCAPFPGGQKHDRKRDMSKTHPNYTEGVPGERWGCAIVLQVRSREPTRRPNGRQKAVPKEYSGALTAPKCARTHTLDAVLAQLRSYPKLHSASQKVPGEGQARAREPKRGPRGA